MSKAPSAIIYCRTSSAGQREQGTIEAQIAWANEATKRDGVRLLPYGNGWVSEDGQRQLPRSAGWVTDDGVSGLLLDGREFKRLIGDIEAGRVRPDRLYVYEPKRLARQDRSSMDPHKRIQSRVDAARIAGVLGAFGVMVVDARGTHDPNSIAWDIQEIMNTDETRGRVQTLIRGKARVLRDNVIATGGRPPYGYERVAIPGRKKGTTYAEHPEDGPRFKTIMEWYVEGGASFAARKANDAGWPPPRAGKGGRAHPRGGKGPVRKAAPQWYPSTVQQLLNRVRDGVYLGKTTRSADGEDFTVTYPALLTRDEYDAIRRRMKERMLKHRTTLLSTGYADCACTTPDKPVHIHGARSQATRAFFVKCGRRDADGSRSDSCGSMREHAFASVLWTAVVMRVLQIHHHEHAASANGKDPFAARLAAAREKLTAVQRQEDALLDLRLSDIIDKATFARRHAPLKEHKEGLEHQIQGIERERAAHEQKKADEQSVEGRVGALLDELANDAQPSLERKRQVLKELLAGEQVIVGWPKSKPQAATITLPAFRDLPPVTVRTDTAASELAGGVILQGPGDLREFQDQLGGPDDPDAKRLKVGDVWVNVQRVHRGHRWFGFQAPDGRFIPFAPVPERKKTRRKAA